MSGAKSKTAAVTQALTDVLNALPLAAFRHVKPAPDHDGLLRPP